jgi:hypothetical protein
MVFINKYLALVISVVAFSAQISASSEHSDARGNLSQRQEASYHGPKLVELSIKLMLKDGNVWSVDRELGIWREGEDATSSLCPVWKHSNCGTESITLDAVGMDRIDESPLSLQCTWLLSDVQNGAMIMGQCGGEELIVKAFLIKD